MFSPRKQKDEEIACDARKGGKGQSSVVVTTANQSDSVSINEFIFGGIQNLTGNQPAASYSQWNEGCRKAFSQKLQGENILCKLQENKIFWMK